MSFPVYLLLSFSAWFALVLVLRWLTRVCERRIGKGEP